MSVRIESYAGVLNRLMFTGAIIYGVGGGIGHELGVWTLDYIGLYLVMMSLAAGAGGIYVFEARASGGGCQ